MAPFIMHKHAFLRIHNIYVKKHVCAIKILYLLLLYARC